MLPLSIVATIFKKLWTMNRGMFFRVFLTWSAVEHEENVKVVMEELPVVDILVSNGWDRELRNLSQQFTHLGIEFHVHGSLFYAPCVAIFQNQFVPENLEILNVLAVEYPLARFARNIFNIFYQTPDTMTAVDDLIEMTMTPHICVKIESMIKTLRRIHYCNRAWNDNDVFSYDRAPLLCNGWVHDRIKHFKPTCWDPKPNVESVQCRPCKAAYVLFMFCNKYYDDMHCW